MVGELATYKCVIYMDYDIPFDFKETRENLFETVVNELSYNLNNWGGVRMHCDYYNCNKITIFKDCGGDNEEWKDLILDILDKELDFVEFETGDPEYPIDSYNVDYIVEFVDTESYHVGDSVRL